MRLEFIKKYKCGRCDFQAEDIELFNLKTMLCLFCDILEQQEKEVYIV